MDVMGALWRWWKGKVRGGYDKQCCKNVYEIPKEEVKTFQIVSYNE